MAAKTLEQVLKSHHEIVKGFQQHKSKLSRVRPSGNRLVVTQKRKLLAAVEQRLEDAIKVRDSSIQRHDASIARIEKSVKRLADEIANDEEKLDKSDEKPRPGRPSGPAPKTPARPAGPKLKQSVLSVRGVGKALEKRLKEGNIKTAGELAAQNPARIAKLLSISEGRATEIVRAAKRDNENGE